MATMGVVETRYIPVSSAMGFYPILQMGELGHREVVQGHVLAGAWS